MASGPNTKVSMDALFKDTLTRITLLERRLAIAGGGGGGGDAVFPPGVVMSWSGSAGAVPNGWLLCDGRAVSRIAYPALYAQIGNTYGAGDGSTTFNLPNGKGRVVVGQDTAQVEFDAVGETGGATTHTHPMAHTHGLSAGYARIVGSGSYIFNDSVATPLWTADSRSAAATAAFTQTGLGAATTLGGATDGSSAASTSAGSSLQPYIVQNWIISTGAGSSNPSGAVVPVQLWQQFTLDPAGAITQPLVGGAVVWNGPVTGTLGATLDASKTTITLPSAGTYRIVTHLGYGANNGVPVSGAVYVGGAAVDRSNTYGSANASLVFNADVEVYVTVTGPTILTQGMSAPNGVYRWSWMRIEKQEPFFPNSALTVNQGSAAMRDSIYGVPTTDVERASLANRKISWFNTDTGWNESYFATTGTTGLTARGLLAGYAHGWYPLPGANISAHRGKSNGFQATPAGSPVEIVLAASQMRQGGVVDSGSGGLQVPIGGYYSITCVNYFSGPAAYDYVGTSLRINGSGISDWRWPKTAADTNQGGNLIYPMSTGSIASLWAITPGTSNAYGTTGYNGSYIELNYLGPPLVNG